MKLHHQRWRRSALLLFSTLGLFALLCVSFLAVPAVHASTRLPTYSARVQTTCSGTGCNNTNPYTTGCNTGTYYVVDSQPVYHHFYNAATGTDTTDGVVHGSIQLWFSSRCGTNWARYTCATQCVSGYALVEWANPTIDPNYCVLGGYLEAGYGANGSYTHQEYLPTTRAEATFTNNAAGTPEDYTKSFSFYAGYTSCD